MINVQWIQQGTCENCGKDNPHCAQLNLNLRPFSFPETPETVVFERVFDALLCAPCVEDLKKRLS